MLFRRCSALLLSLVLHLVLLSLRLERRTAPAGMLPSSAGDASQLAAWSEQLLQDICAFGRLPKAVRGSSEAQVRERNEQATSAAALAAVLQHLAGVLSEVHAMPVQLAADQPVVEALQDDVFRAGA